MSRKRFTYRTQSPEETVQLGRRLGRFLDAGDLVVLTGELGSGKTWFTKGIALGLDITEVVTSPSFALMNAYEGRETLFHMDVYRLEDLDDFLDTGLAECFEGDGIAVMEWGGKWPEILPPERVTVDFRILGEQSREVVMIAQHNRMIEILSSLNDTNE